MLMILLALCIPLAWLAGKEQNMSSEDYLASKSPPLVLSLGLILFIALLAFYGGAIVGAQEQRNQLDFADEDLASAQRVTSQFVMQARGDDPLLAQAKGLLKTIEELQEARQDRGLTERE